MAIIRTYPDSDILATAVADHILDTAQESVSSHGMFAIALSGGSTPLPVYQLLAQPPYSEEMPWEYVHIFWSDERTVPPGHEKSNFSAANRILIEPLSLPEQNIHRIKGEIEPQEAADEYEQDIRDLVGGQPPSFDLILLGLGPDAHTASLFPHSSALVSPPKSRLVVPNFVEKLDSWRITFTPRLINAARHVAFLVTGDEKADCVYQVLAGRHQPVNVPAQAIRPDNGALSWYLDHRAARHIHT